MSQSAGKTVEEMKMWLTCAIESEGSFQLAWGKRSDGYIQIVPRVNLGNKDSEFIERVQEYATALGVPAHISTYVSPIKMRYMEWVGFKRVKRLIEVIKPILLTRKSTIASKIVEFIDHRLSLNPHVQYGQKEKDLFLEVRALNGKGMIADQLLKCRFENPAPILKKACLTCGKVFQYRRKDQEFCSRACQFFYGILND